MISYQDKMKIIDGNSGDTVQELNFPSNISHIVSLIPGAIVPSTTSATSLNHLNIFFSNLNENSQQVAKVFKVDLELPTQDSKYDLGPCIWMEHVRGIYV